MLQNLIDSGLQAVFHQVREHRLPGEILQFAICCRAGHAFGEWSYPGILRAPEFAHASGLPCTIRRACTACGYIHERVFKPLLFTCSGTDPYYTISLDSIAITNDTTNDLEEAPRRSDARPVRYHATKKRRWRSMLSKRERKRRARNRRARSG